VDLNWFHFLVVDFIFWLTDQTSLQEDLCKTSPAPEKETSQATVLNSFEPLVVFEQVYRTCLRRTDPLQSDVGCRYPLKLFNIISNVYPSHPVLQVHDRMVETEVPKEGEAENNMFHHTSSYFIIFHPVPRACFPDPVESSHPLSTHRGSRPWLVWAKNCMATQRVGDFLDGKLLCIADPAQSLSRDEPEEVLADQPLLQVQGGAPGS
jgi:hypothetical protein